MENNDFALSEREEDLLSRLVQLRLDMAGIKERQALIMGELAEVKEILDSYRCDGK